MNRMIRGVAGLLVALGASACASDYGLDFETGPTQIQASPEVMFITSGAAEKELLLRLTNDINQSVPTSFTVSNVPAGLTVRHDDNYRPDYVNGDGTLQQPDKLVQQRYYVSAALPQGAQVSFTVSSGGFSKDITVRVLPVDAGATLSNLSPALGEPVTITAPANQSFTSSATVSLVDSSASPVTTSSTVITSQDAKSITFVPFPGTKGQVQVNGVTLDYAPTLAPRTLSTTSAITGVPAIPTKPTLGTTAPALGDPVTITAGAGQNFAANAGVTFPAGGAPVITGRTATTITFLPRPGTTGAATVSGVILTDNQASVLGTFSVATSNSITVPAVTQIAGTFSNASPAAGATVTFSAPGFKFLPSVQVKFGSKAAAVTALSADSATITILPPVGVTASVATITNAVLSFLVEVPLAATPTSAAATLTTPGTYNAPQLANGDPVGANPNPAAPVLAVSNSAPNAGLFDGGAWTGADAFDGGGPNRWYKFTVAGATRNRPISVDWQGNAADMDLYVVNNAITAYVGSGSASAGSSHPEAQTLPSVAAGSYWVILVNWGHGGDPNWVFTVVQ